MKTYAELKSLVEDTNTRPTKALILAQEPLLIEEYEDASTHIRIYRNGWVTYEDENRRTNFNLNWYSQLYYDVDLLDGELTSEHIIPELEYGAYDWLIPITVIAQNRIEKHTNRNYTGKTSPLEDNMECNEVLILREIDVRESTRMMVLIHKAMETLPPRQREVIELYYGDEEVTDCDVGRWLGIARNTATAIRNHAEKRIRKYCSQQC